MAQPNFDYEGALNAGYTEDEINDFLKTNYKNQDFISNKNFDVEGALKAGYSKDEISEFLSNYKPERSFLDKAGRLAGQFALGATEMAALPYELAVAPLAIPGGQEAIGDLFTREILSDVYPTEEEGKFVGQRELAEPLNLGVRGLAEKATGLDLHPEGILEKAANWAGFLKNPKSIASLAKSGLKTKDVVKAISPTREDALRGLGAGTALQMAEEGDLGPIGTMAAAVVGDAAGGGSLAVLKGSARLAKHPKKVLSEAAAKFTPKEKLDLQKQMIKDFREAGVQADLGTITDSNLIKWTQSRLAQSGFTGKSLDKFREDLTSQIKNEYKSLADALGEDVLASKHQAGELAVEGMKWIREADLEETRNLYINATKSLKENSVVEVKKLAKSIENLEKELKPGSIKSTEQQAVLKTLEGIKKDLYTPRGTLKLAKVKDLMNNKIALNDIINYEVQGGAKQLLKNIVGELDRAIISHGNENIPFVRNYISANKRFSNHAKTFRNKTSKQIFNAEDPAQIINKMNTVQGIKNIEKILSKTSDGQKIFGKLKRFKLERMIGDNFIDSATQQIKLGTFSKLAEKGQNKEILKEILGSDSFKRLERLQKNAGRLADSAQKFYNASKSGVAAIDAAILSKGISDISNILMGNPWPLIKTGGGILSARKLGSLLADPDFLKLVEDVLLAAERGNSLDLIRSIDKLKPYLMQAIEQIKDRD